MKTSRIITKYLLISVMASCLFVFSSLFWTKDVANNHDDLSTIELGWPKTFITQDFSSIDPPAGWYPHKVGLGLPQEHITDFSGINFILNWIIISAGLFIIIYINLIKKFFELLGFKFGLQPGERYVCFEVPELRQTEKHDKIDWEWLDGGINSDLPVIVGHLDISGEFCVTITDPEFSPEDVIKILESKGYKAKVKSIRVL